MNPDIQIYINNLRNYLKSSDKARELFLSGLIELDDFMVEVEKISIINVEEGRDPQLTREQYEEIRSSLNPYQTELPTFQMEGFPPIFLN
jgi:hypothetical protein